MKTITKPVYGPDNRKFAASFAQVDNLSATELEAVVKEMGLTVEDVNTALRKARKQYYDAALESTPETRLEKAKKSMEDLGAFSAEEIELFINSARAKAKDSLPKGLTPVLHPEDHPDPAMRGKQVIGKPRGRAAAEKPAETAATT